MTRDKTFYLDLVTSQYRAADNFQKWLSAALGYYDDLASVMDNLPVTFTLDQAQGAQLDTLGKFLGLSRRLPFNPPSGSAVLTDVIYRQALKLLVIKNLWQGDYGLLRSTWIKVLGLTKFAVVDNMNMTINVNMTGTVDTTMQAMITNDLLFPRPQGVTVTYTFTAPN